MGEIFLLFRPSRRLFCTSTGSPTRLCTMASPSTQAVLGDPSYSTLSSTASWRFRPMSSASSSYSRQAWSVSREGIIKRVLEGGIFTKVLGVGGLPQTSLFEHVWKYGSAKHFCFLTLLFLSGWSEASLRPYDRTVWSLSSRNPGI